MTIPDFLPLLRRGPGVSPEHGGCLMQVAGFLADGSSWTDSPDCVHKVLTKAAISVNDAMPNSDRHRLGPLAPRFVGTSEFTLSFQDELQLALWAIGTLVPFAGASIGYVRWAQKILGGLIDYREARGLMAAVDNDWRPVPSEHLTARAAYTATFGFAFQDRSGFLDTLSRCGALHGAHGDGAEFLEGLLDKFDRIAGRSPRDAFTPQPHLMQRVLSCTGSAEAEE